MHTAKARGSLISKPKTPQGVLFFFFPAKIPFPIKIQGQMDLLRIQNLAVILSRKKKKKPTDFFSFYMSIFCLLMVSSLQGITPDTL